MMVIKQYAAQNSTHANKRILRFPFGDFIPAIIYSVGRKDKENIWESFRLDLASFSALLYFSYVSTLSGKRTELGCKHPRPNSGRKRSNAILGRQHLAKMWGSSHSVPLCQRKRQLNNFPVVLNQQLTCRRAAGYVTPIFLLPTLRY